MLSCHKSLIPATYHVSPSRFDSVPFVAQKSLRHRLRVRQNITTSSFLTILSSPPSLTTATPAYNGSHRSSLRMGHRPHHHAPRIRYVPAHLLLYLSPTDFPQPISYSKLYFSEEHLNGHTKHHTLERSYHTLLSCSSLWERPDSMPRGYRGLSWMRMSNMVSWRLTGEWAEIQDLEYHEVACEGDLFRKKGGNMALLWTR